MRSMVWGLLLYIFFTSCFAASLAPSNIEWNGKEYHENALLQSGWALTFLNKHLKLNGKEAILDIGSGDGKISAQMAQKLPNGHVLGIDNSPSMLAEANSANQKIHNLHFLKQKAEDVAFYQQYKNKFDVVTSFCTLHWVKDQSRVLKGIEIALKPQGKFFLTICSDGGDPIQVIADKLIKDDRYKTLFVGFVDPVTRFNPKQYEVLVKAANLQVLSIEDSEQKDIVENKEKLIKQLKSWLPHYHYLKKTSPKNADGFMVEVVNEYLKQNPTQADGKIVLYDRYLEVVGSK